MNKKRVKTIFWVFLFSIAMAFMESAIVVYLRELYYPEGFNFPLQTLDFNIALTEFLREIATLIMFVMIGFLIGKTGIQKFAFFILPFAVWDIFYYIFLKLLINWPGSIFTWDVLFLVPTTWVGPVLGPVINSLTMIVLSMVLLWLSDKNSKIKTGWLVWMLLIAGSIIVIVSYTEEYIRFMMQEFTFWQLMGVSDKDKILELALQFIPRHYQWWIFIVGEGMHLLAISLILLRNRNN